MILLIPTALQRQVAPRLDLAPDILHIGHFITLGFLAAPTALFAHVVQRIVAVLRGQQLQFVIGMHVGFVARADLAGDQRQVGTGDSYQVAAGFQFRTLLGDVVELGGGFGAAFFAF